MNYSWRFTLCFRQNNVDKVLRWWDDSDSFEVIRCHDVKIGDLTTLTNGK